MAETSWEAWKRRIRRKIIHVSSIPRAQVIYETRALHLLIELLGSQVEAHRVLAQIKSDGLAIELQDGSTLMSRQDGSLVLLAKEVNRG